MTNNELKEGVFNGGQPVKGWRSRFWEKVNKTADCWLWTGATVGNNYGVLTIGIGPSSRRQYYAHRLSYLIHFGDFSDTLMVCHKCDNSLCVNPEHLFLGTQDDNMADAAKKGRTSRGTGRALAKLTDKMVVDIRRRYETERITQRQLSKIYGVSDSGISKIVRRMLWAHVQ